MVKDYNEKITWINTSCVPAISSWTRTNATVSGEFVTIAPGGSISTSYTDTGKKAAKYRRYIIQYDETNITQTNNYQNDLMLDEYALCKDINNEYTQVQNCIPLTQKGPSLESVGYILMLDRACLNQDITTSEIKLVNNSSNSILIKNVTIFRSNDVTGQTGDVINNYIYPDSGDTGGIDVNPDGKLVYLVPTMTLSEWNSVSKTEFNEAIIIG